MNDFYNVGSWLMSVFSDFWSFIYNDMGWIGVALLGFVVIRLLAIVFRTFMSGARRNGE